MLIRNTLQKTALTVSTLLTLGGCAWVAGLEDVPTHAAADARVADAAFSFDTEDPTDPGPLEAGAVRRDAATTRPPDAAAAPVDAGQPAPPAFVSCAASSASRAWSGSRYFCEDFEDATVPWETFTLSTGDTTNLTLVNGGTRELQVRIPSQTSGSSQSEVSQEFVFSATEMRVHFSMRAPSRTSASSYVAEMGMAPPTSGGYHALSLYWRTTGVLSATFYVGSQQQTMEIAGLGPGVTHEIDVQLTATSARVRVGGILRATLSGTGAPVLRRAQLRLGCNLLRRRRGRGALAISARATEVDRGTLEAPFPNQAVRKSLRHRSLCSVLRRCRPRSRLGRRD
jgi:hypothetical protein